VILGVTGEGLKVVVRLFADYWDKFCQYELPDLQELRNFLSTAAQANGMTPPEDPLLVDAAPLRLALVSSSFYSFLTNGGTVDVLAISQLSALAKSLPPLAFSRLIAREVSKECRENLNPRIAYSRGIRAGPFFSALSPPCPTKCLTEITLF